MNKLYIMIFILLLSKINFGLQPFIGELKNLTQTDITQIKTYKNIQHLVIESYLNEKESITQVLGFQYDSYWSKNHFFSTAIYGAVGGTRGGFGIAFIGLGTEKKLVNNIDINTRFYVGSGGGGGVSAGGGLGLQILTGLSYKLKKDWFLNTRIGYIMFPSGEFSSSIISIGLAHQTKRLVLPF